MMQIIGTSTETLEASSTQSCPPLNARRSWCICRGLNCKYGAGPALFPARPLPVTPFLAGKRKRDITARLFCELIGSGSAGYFCNVDPVVEVTITSILALFPSQYYGPQC